MKKIFVYAFIISVTLACSSGCQQCSSTDCLSCSPGYFLQDNACTFCQNYCYTCESSTTCSACNQNYYVSNGICDACSQGCQICDDAATCTKCFNSFYLNQLGSCSACEELCATCANGTSCETCKTGYYYKDGACNICPLKCDKCENNIGCTSCLTGYYASSGACSKCKDNCQTCTDGNTCQTCPYEYYRNSSKLCTACSTCGNFELCKMYGSCTAVEIKPEASNSKTLILNILVPIVGVLVFSVSAYLIVSKVLKKPQAEIVQSKGTIPTEGQIQENKASSGKKQNENGDTNRQLDNEIRADTL